MLSQRILRRWSRRPIRSSSLPCSSRLITSTPSRSIPAAQLAEAPEDYSPPAYYHTPPSVSASLGGYNFHNLPPIQLPSPLPTDVKPSASHSALYPSTGIIDSTSMISICLRRPEHVPRAYLIFKQLLSDTMSSEDMGAKMPDAEIWGRVIEGVASLGKEDHKDAQMLWQTWRGRALRLVHLWEGNHGVKDRGYAALDKGGIKVYQGLFAGMIRSSTPLTHFVPYLQTGSLAAARLLASIPPSDLPLAYEALEDIARAHQMQDLSDAVSRHRALETEKREILARETVEEIKPVRETDGKNLLKRTNDSSEVVEGEGAARFAVTNLRKTLSNLSSPSLPINRQFALERASYDAARIELEHSAKLLEQQGITAVAEAQALQRDQLQGWMYIWLGELTEKLRSDIAEMNAKVADSKVTARTGQSTPSSGLRDEDLVIYLNMLSVDKLALITILELMRMSGSGGIVDGMKATRGMLGVGKAVETEYRAETIKNVAGVDSPHWLRTIDPATHKPSRPLVSSVWRQLGKMKGDDSGEGESTLGAIWTPPWSQLIQLGVGSYLANSLLSVAVINRRGRDRLTGEEISEKQPAFSHAYEYVRGKKLGVIKVNPVVASRLAKDSISSFVHPKHLPMLVEPAPWTSFRDGGYMLNKVPIMRYKESVEQQTYLREASEQGHLEPVFHGLDVLSSTPWTINRNVFNVVLNAWNSGEPIADIPASEDKAQYDLPIKPQSREVDPAKRAVFVEQVKAALNAQRKDHAERCKFNYNLEIARSYLNDVFYLPHNMDFRGRAYPIPPHLSPVGDDLCRGLLTFGVKKPLGKTGLKWLQIHLANVYGFDKASFEERARFAQDHEADIFDTADKPLDGNRWWLKAEDPWQCLATCFELAAALRCEDPTAYESSLPVHQDGTCNGMQHYAALGGDVRGARAVNLENGDRPADIYTGVADIVNKVIIEDKKAGHPIANLIDAPLGRKVVKQTVMTTVYGVTFIGARDQIAKQLTARGDIPHEHIFTVSSYVAKTVLSCIGDLFSGAKAIMEWLTTSARLVSRSIPPDRVEQAAQELSIRTTKGPVTRIAKELMTSVIWTTPLGLPVVQPYRKAVKKQVMTALQTVYISDPNAPSEVSPQKQATAFPPNYIHSLDATHMMLTAVKCQQSQITFASVHDSYWTHAATVEPMSELIRDTFIHLHSQDLIGELRDEFIARYGEHRIPVKNAKEIASSLTRKKVKDAERTKQIAAVLAEHADADAHSPKDILEARAELTEEQHASEVEVLSSGGGQADSLEDSLSAADPDEMEEIGDSPSPPPTKNSTVVDTVGLSNADLENLEKRQGQGIKIDEERVGNTRFVKFRDVVPPCPPKGVFDVERIRNSAYFFS